jgi:xylulokinase
MYLGLDLGTSGVKALLIDGGQGIVGAGHGSLDVSRPHHGWSEQDPADWWSASLRSIREVLRDTGIAAEQVVGVGLTGQMHGLVLLDDAGEVLRPAILWNDQRTAAECAEITRAVGAERVLAITGNPVLPGFTAPKLVWVRKHEPEVYARVAHILLPKD